MIDIFSDQTLYERVIFALTGQFYHRAGGSAAALLLRPTIQKKRAKPACHQNFGTTWEDQEGLVSST